MSGRLAKPAPTPLATALVVGAILGVTTPAGAQPAPPSPSPEPAPVVTPPPQPAPVDAEEARKETARNLYRLGNERFSAGDARGALEAYQGADAIMAAPTTGYKVGMALAAVGRLVEARGKLLTVLRMPVGPDETSAFAKARQDAAELAQALRDRIPTVQVELGGVKPGEEAELVIDGVTIPAGAVHLPHSLDPGAHVLQAAIGGREVSERVQLVEGQRSTVRLQIPAAVDNSVSVAPQASVSPLVYVGFTVAGAGLLAGIPTGVVSLSAASDAEGQCNANLCPPAAADDIAVSEALGHVSTVSFAVGGAGLVLGIVGLLIADDDGAEAGVTATAQGLLVRF